MTSQIPLPEKLDSKRPEDWKKWIDRFRCYSIASDLVSKPATVQINTLIYAMGGNANETLESFHVSTTNKEEWTFEKIVERFNRHFVGRTNTIFERARFNRRVQRENEPVIDFIDDLYKLAQTCQFGELTNELIRDRIVVGIRNNDLSRKLMQDENLDLNKAVKQAKASEMIKEHQEILKANISFVKRDDSTKRRPKFSATQEKEKKCFNCGGKFHRRQECPARNATCFKCQQKGHFRSVCRSSSVNYVEDDQEEEYSEAFLGIIDSNDPKQKWKLVVKIGQTAVEFKIDTGADVTVIPTSVYNQSGLDSIISTKKKLFGPGQIELNVVGRLTTTLVNDRTTITDDVYVVNDLKEPLLGRPAIEKFDLFKKINNVTQTGSDQLGEKIKHKYPKLFNGLGTMDGEFSIKLVPEAKPFALTTPRRVALPLMGKVKEELARMENLDVITKIPEGVPTEWCAGMVVVPKPDGRIRICVDLTKLNDNILREPYPLPRIDDLLGKIGDSKFFSKVDANSGFWQQKLTPEAKLLTTFITPFGRYCFNRMPFGVKTAPEHFEMKMQLVLEGVDGIVSLIDDILIHGMTQEEHDSRLHATLQRLEGAGITLNSDKCVFSKSEVKFAGYVINGNGIKSDPDKVKAIKEMPAPTSVSDVRRFLGMVNQQAKFVPHLAEKTSSMRDLLNKKNDFTWGIQQQKAFDDLKSDLSNTPTLAYYDPTRETTISADASSFGLGAVLMQKQADGTMKPVAYASRSMTSSEQRYAQIEKEALATTWACEKFSNYIIGKDITIETDHKPLVPLLGSKALYDMPPRIQRFRMRLMRYSYTIKHIPGKDLVIADTLSRAPLSGPLTKQDKQLSEDLNLYVSSVIEGLPASEKRLQQIRSYQNEDEVCQQLKEFSQGEWPDKSNLRSALKSYWPERSNITIQQGLLMKDTRIIIPSAMRLEILDAIHAGHQGIRKCRERAQCSVWWPGLSKQIEDMVTTCKACCEERKNHSEPMIETKLPERPWQKVATDLFYLKGKPFVLVVDYFSRYFEIAPLRNETSEDVVEHMKSIFARHGIPETVISDNGPQYSASSFSKFSEEWGFTHLTSSPRYPQSNGEAERAVQTVKNLLKKSGDPYLAMLSYRATPLHNGISPAQLLMGRKLRTTLPVTPEKLQPSWPDLADLQTKEAAYKKQQSQSFNNYHRARDLPELLPGDKVWLTGQRKPGMVIRKSDEPRSYIVKTETSPGGIRRNRRHLVANPNDTSSYTPSNDGNQQRNLDEETLAPEESSSYTTTRSGRVVVPPKRLDL